MEAERPFRIVTGVLREALRRARRSGLVVAGGGPEEALLLRWLGRAGIPCLTPPAGLLEEARALLARARAPALEAAAATPGEGPRWPEGEEWAASGLAGRALARGRNALLAGAETKTLLVLGHHPTGAAILPLGDLWASEVQELAGGCTVPAPFPSQTPTELMAADAALRACLEEGARESAALAGLPVRIRDAIAGALEEGRASWHPPVLVPKLGRATLGIDLDL